MLLTSEITAGKLEIKESTRTIPDTRVSCQIAGM